MEIINITPTNAKEHSFFCIKNTKEPGFRAKYNWFGKQVKEGLTLKILIDDEGKQAGFIEYIPAEFAWRPVKADGFVFIHCIMIYPNSNKRSGNATRLLNTCLEEARKKRKNGVCVMTSEGSWMAGSDLFKKNGFEKVDQKGRFALYALKFEPAVSPKLINWEDELSRYTGWNLIYADQCPWHEKCIVALSEFAVEKGIDLKIKKIETVEEAKKAPSGFGVFSLVKDGKLLGDHYISKTRFKTIIEKEIN